MQTVERGMSPLFFNKPEMSKRPIAVPCIRISLYIPPGESSDPNNVAKAIKDYLRMIPDDALVARIRIDEDVDEEAQVRFEPFDPKMTPALADEYRNELYSGTERHSVTLVPGHDYGATGFTLESLFANPPDPIFAGWRNSIRFDFGMEFSKSKIRMLIEFARSLIDSFPDCTLVGSSAVSHLVGVTPIIQPELNGRLMRFVALDPGYRAMHFDIGADIPFPAWLTYVNAAQIARIGGRHILKNRLPKSCIWETDDGMLLRAAAFAPFGDVNRSALDVGSLPVFDKLLAPALLTEVRKIRNFEPAAAQKWIERFSDVDSQPWDNETIVTY